MSSNSRSRYGGFAHVVAQDQHRLRVLTLTADEIEAALRTAALRAVC